jgi:hypothetical protein
VHREDQGWERAQRGTGGGREHKEDQGWDRALREPGVGESATWVRGGIVN